MMRLANEIISTDPAKVVDYHIFVAIHLKSFLGQWNSFLVLTPWTTYFAIDSSVYYSPLNRI